MATIFGSTDDIICAVEGFMEGQDVTIIRDGIAVMKNLRSKYNDAMGTQMKNSIKTGFLSPKPSEVRFE